MCRKFLSAAAAAALQISSARCAVRTPVFLLLKKQTCEQKQIEDKISYKVLSDTVLGDIVVIKFVFIPNTCFFVLRTPVFCLHTHTHTHRQTHRHTHTHTQTRVCIMQSLDFKKYISHVRERARERERESVCGM